MKIYVTILAIVLGPLTQTRAMARPNSTKLLECNTEIGPDQQVTVLQDGEVLTLVELTSTGNTVSRPLSRVEWQSQILQLRDANDSKSTLSRDPNGGWFLRSMGSGFNEMGFVDCAE